MIMTATPSTMSSPATTKPRASSSSSSPSPSPSSPLSPADSRSVDRSPRLLQQLPSNASSSSAVPSTPRFVPPTPPKSSGRYTPTATSSRDHNLPGRPGSKSVSNSPPGTPPHDLRNYYLNAALQRSHHPLYSIGSAPGSSTSLQRLNTFFTAPTPGRIQAPEPAAKRSYSAEQFRAGDSGITVSVAAAEGTSSAETVSHVLSLEYALSNLIENQDSQVEDEGGKTTDGEDTDGPIMMMISKSSSSSSSFTPPRIPSNGKGTEKAAAKGSDMTSTIATTSEASEKTNKHKKRTNHLIGRKISRLFHRDRPDALNNPRHALSPENLVRQPSKAGVLSHLLKLHGHGRQHKHLAQRTNERRLKRPKMYSRSANNSVASLNKSFLGTYPPLPTTPSQSSTTTSLSNFQPNPRIPNRSSMLFESPFKLPFSALNSPFQTPGGSPRRSFSGFEYNSNGDSHLESVSNATTANGSYHGLSQEEKLRIAMTVADLLERQDYILRLAKSMIKYGAPSHRLENAIDHSAKALELNLQCIYLPNVMIIAFTDYETHTSETHVLKVSAGLDMYKCALVHQVHKMVTHSSMPVTEAIMKLDAISAEKDANPRWLTVLAYATASFCTAPLFFNGSWIDAGVSFLMGGAVGLLVWLSEKVPSYAHICEVTMSVVVAFVAEALHNTSICQSAVKMAGIIIILPGYTITCSILELSSRHIISGSVRLFYAVVFSLLLGYGLTIGTSIWTLIDPSRQDAQTFATGCPMEPLNPKWNLLFVPLFAISLNIWLMAHPRQWFLATILSIVGYTVSFSSSTYAGAKTEVSSALAAFAIGFIGNIYQRLTRQLSFQAVVCAVFFLVPGSLGLKGAMSLYTEDMTGGVNFALQMVVTAIAVSVGLFASALAVYPMGKTRSAQMTF